MGGRSGRALLRQCPDLRSGFKAGAERDVGHKLETAVFLECRRHTPEWHYHAGDGELDLCDAEDRLFINTCWNLADASTAEREAAAMAAGARLLPKAKNALVYHEHSTVSSSRTSWPDAVSKTSRRAARVFGCRFHTRRRPRARNRE